MPKFYLRMISVWEFDAIVHLVKFVIYLYATLVVWPLLAIYVFTLLVFSLRSCLMRFILKL